MKRRRFIGSGLAAALVAPWVARRAVAAGNAPPVVVSTWAFGKPANAEALRVLAAGGSPLDAVEAGVRVTEADPAVQSVGYGGLPNVDGVVELDAAIVDGDTLEAGAVAGLQSIKHPVSVARRVLEKTPHVMLVGRGAQRFALRQGFTKEKLLTPESRRAWKKGPADPGPGNHDTIGMCLLAPGGGMAAACTTSGLGWKLPGRVGDSPLVGHGLYCDSRAGAAAATGVGEEVIKVCGSYQVVEFMRQGLEPDEAVRRVLSRIVRRTPGNTGLQVAFVALRADGAYGFGAIRDGFTAAVSTAGGSELLERPGIGATLAG